MKRTYILFAEILLVTATASALPTDSLTRDTIDGKVVYKYQVQKAEGLYRISKNFGVSQEDIISLNPVLKTEGLKLGQTIYIPTVEQFDSTQYIVHTLEPKETLYGLSRRYGVSQKEIERLNPQTVKRMAIGTSLLIKKRDIEPAPVVVEQTSITTKQPQIETLPTPTDSDIDNSPLTESLNTATSTATEPPADSANISALPLRLAFMLPFMTDAPKRDANIDRFVDFYEGALIAIYEAQQQGQRFEIYTYDVEKTDLAVQQVLGKGELQMVDAIIGPAYPAQVSYATLFAKQNKISLLIPFTQKVAGIEHTPSVLQFNPTPETAAKALVSHLEARKDSVRFIFVDASDKDIPQSVKAVHNSVRNAGFEVANTTIKDILADSLSTILSNERENIVVFNSEKYSSVQVLISKLQPSGYDIMLFGHYSWTTEQIPVPLIYTTVFHQPDAVRIGHYETLYHHYFEHAHAETHPRYDLLGYDLTRALIMQLQNCAQEPNEQLTDECIKARIEGIQSDVIFSRVSEQGGRINEAINVIKTTKQ